MDHRSILDTSTAALAGAIAGCVLPGVASTSPKTPFTAADTTVPIVGSERGFPVRRIDCIGRNHAAQAREMCSDPTREPRSSLRSRPTRSSSSRPAWWPTLHIRPRRV
jgi:hypothetical protein